jgi:hypothetical protein
MRSRSVRAVPLTDAVTHGRPRGATRPRGRPITWPLAAAESIPADVAADRALASARSAASVAGASRWLPMTTKWPNGTWFHGRPRRNAVAAAQATSDYLTSVEAAPLCSALALGQLSERVRPREPMTRCRQDSAAARIPMALLISIYRATSCACVDARNRCRRGGWSTR